ncbi:MAG: TolC family protein [Rickettsiales bacterium]|nr:TolC family protein [Rickettsiales bacterium]
MQIIFTLFLLLFAIQNSFAVTIDDAINEAKSGNRNIKLEKLRAKAVRSKKREAIAEFLPSVKVKASYGQRRSHYNGNQNDPSLRQSSRELVIEQPIFDGFHSVSKYREANYHLKSANLKALDKEQEISFVAAQVYCELYRYQRVAKLQEENFKLAQKFLSLAKRRKYFKIIDKADIIKFQFEASINEEKSLDAKTRLNKAQIDYVNVIGKLDGNLVKPNIPREYFNEDKIVSEALRGNKSVESSRNSYIASKYAYSAERSNLSPKVYLTGTMDKQESVIYLNNRDLTNRSLFLNLSVPLFNKGIEYSNIAKARYEKQSALEEYEIAKDNLVKEASRALSEYKFYGDINKSNKKLFKMAKQRSNIFHKRKESRVEDPIEVIKVQIEQNDREINLINSEMDLAIVYYKIKYLTGQL